MIRSVAVSSADRSFVKCGASLAGWDHLVFSDKEIVVRECFPRFCILRTTRL